MFGRVSSPRSAWTPRWRQHPEVLFFNPHLASNCSTCCIGMRFMLAFQRLCRAFQLLCTLWNTTASSQVAVHVNVEACWTTSSRFQPHETHIQYAVVCLNTKEPWTCWTTTTTSAMTSWICVTLRGKHRFKRQIINKTTSQRKSHGNSHCVWDQLSKSSKSSSDLPNHRPLFLEKGRAHHMAFENGNSSALEEPKVYCSYWLLIGIVQ